MTQFNAWIFNKISFHLKHREGCVIEKSYFNQEGSKTIFRDSFGFRYEMEVKQLGRLQDPEELKVNKAISKVANE